MTFSLGNGQLFCWQWDVKQNINIAGTEDLSTTVLLIGNPKKQKELYKVNIKQNGDSYSAAIPDEILQADGRADVYLYDEKNGTTKLFWRFTIKPKARPHDYIYEPTELITISEINLKVEELLNETIPQLETSLHEYVSQEIYKAEFDDVVIDETLKIAGRAADAKITGEKIDQIKNNYLPLAGGNINGPLSAKGTGWFADGLKVGGVDQNDPNAEEVATKGYVDSSVTKKVEEIDCIYFADIGKPAYVDKINADTLQGKAASDFAPSGFGLGSTSYISNTNTTKSGFYSFPSDAYNAPAELGAGNMVVAREMQIAMTSSTTNNTIAFKNYQASDRKWEYLNPPMITEKVYPTVERIRGRQVYKKLNASGVIMYSLDQTNWYPYGSLMGAGLAQELSPVVDNCNNAITNGWHNITAGAQNSPFTKAAQLFCESSDTSNKKQTISSEGHACQRFQVNGSWQPWEWINPPMLNDIEYRTTERWEGHVVYKRIITVPSFVNNGLTVASIPVTAEEGTPVIITMSGYVSSGTENSSKISFPYKDQNGSRELRGYLTNGKIAIFSNFDATSWHGRFEVKYYKA